EVGFPVRRVFYIYGVAKPRGGHSHKRTKTALIAVHGEVRVHGQSPKEDFSFDLRSPDQCLLLEVEDWHAMDFSKDAVLLVLAS
ncbi:FdtA/QdtA family cupin domain-containing protein, partial [Salmonella enterica]|uniref:sugar 3,4-ketoisomerase n=1 Tax=Salmonella enterica TaxID=28901 RepID=UPI001C68FCE5